MNFLLTFNKTTLLISSFFIISIICFFISFTYIQAKKIADIEISINNKTADISKPKFSINSNKQKISVTANEGNFLTENEIMLEKNVIFKSDKFKIYSDNVLFNKKSLIASSKNKSKFVSDKTSIDSNGFDIIENGNIINFKGKTKLILK
ncbi:MAG: LPS export ABC transporter periplasmic protein LptC [Pelagibacteraceae bacterium]|nr:LPS export ABC transporter periplasmic protein LptC [Pelagibacteraceae bacterium]MBT4645960.1 LPS export ABC transporter periplasmic protein LptC [Pelagibacteraceae bacterium]MBT6354625.1 LPS export ABC transporter periplasmic protein LptC [Pelagibacteraceae bacterium]